MRDVDLFPTAGGPRSSGCSCWPSSSATTRIGRLGEAVAGASPRADRSRPVGPVAAVLDEYAAALTRAPLSEQTRRTYASKVRQYLAWLADVDTEGVPLHEKDARDWAVRDHRTHLQAVLKRKPATVNNALVADDLYIRRGLEGPPTPPAPSCHGPRPRRWTRAPRCGFCARPGGARRRAVALVPFYAGTRIAEIVGLDVDDVRLWRARGSCASTARARRSARSRSTDLRSALSDWIDERADWPGADTPALFLNQRGGRLSVKGAHEIITTIATAAGLEDDEITAHALRHTFATRLVRGRTDLVIVAELLGHARLETTRAYSRPTRQDAVDALELLDADR